MDYSSLIAPAVVAAVISGVVSTIGIWISTRTTKAIHGERVAFDREQAERRFDAEIALAQKKVALDKALETWKRRTELAESVLADFYKAREIVHSVRSPGGSAGEDNTRQKEPWENEDDARILNSYFRTVERRVTASSSFERHIVARKRRAVS
jgi:hypothetical protein